MIDSYFYKLPEKLIASEPAKPRERSRLLVFNSAEDKIIDDVFSNLNFFLKKGDLLVLNDSKVFPARIFGTKETGGKIEVLLLEDCGDSWLAMVGGKTKLGDKVLFQQNLEGQIIEKKDKEVHVKFNISGKNFWQVINKIGKTPIPPYIKNTKLSEKNLRQEYQTVFANNFGSAAAPTAGMHFSKSQIGDLGKAGVDIAYIDLNIGLGTFAPLTPENLLTKKLHSEKFQIPSSTIRKIIQTKKEGGRVIAVGTTTVRTLESAAKTIIKNEDKITNIAGSTEIFVQPGFKFKIVDSLITNFHLPSSSLMMLVAALIQDKGINDGREKLLEIYKYAINKKYRFYSFGDAMLIL